jgi:hypothetical protein
VSVITVSRFVELGIRPGPQRFSALHPNIMCLGDGAGSKVMVDVGTAQSSELLHVRAPDSHCCSPRQGQHFGFVRRALLEKLRGLGIDPAIEQPKGSPNV